MKRKMTARYFRQSVRPRLILYPVLILLSAMMLLPFFWMITSSFKNAGEIYLYPIQWLPSKLDWGAYRQLFEDFSFGTYLWNTVWLTGVNIIGYVLTCAMAAFGFATQEWKHKNKLFFIVLITMMLPKDVTFYPQFIIFRLIGWYGTMTPLWLPAFFADAFQIFLIRQFFMGISYELNEAAKIDGCSRYRIFFQIYLPLSKPVLATSAIYVFMYHWNDFFKPLIYITRENGRTATLALMYLRSTQDVMSSVPAQMAGAVVLALPCVIIYYFCQRYFIAGSVYKGVK
ncbi:MAG: carbohydrate ABC transporter permease [Eubacteriales bacterium]|nr:carbohydrate ABC transporter permease [Eubacteriales bacterium]